MECGKCGREIEYLGDDSETVFRVEVTALDASDMLSGGPVNYSEVICEDCWFSLSDMLH